MTADNPDRKMRQDRWTCFLQRAQQGDATAFEQLVREARPRILRRIQLKLRDEAEASAAAARTFVKAWQNLASFDASQANASTWLFTIARNLVNDLLKSQRSRQRREVVGLDNSNSGSSEGDDLPRQEPEDRSELPVAEELDQPGVDALVEQALQQLRPDDRIVLQLCYFEHLRYEDIAERLGIGVKAVGPRLTRARQRMLEMLPPEVLERFGG